MNGYTPRVLRPQQATVETSTEPTMQLNILMGLRIVEGLGKAVTLPSKYDIAITPDSSLISILNFITLCIERNVSLTSSRHDIAAAISATAGSITVHLARGDAMLPSRRDVDMVHIFVNTLRRVIFEGLASPYKPYSPKGTYDLFMWMLAEHVYPLFVRKVAVIGAAQDDHPEQTFQRFQQLVDAWLKRKQSKSETDSGKTPLVSQYEDELARLQAPFVLQDIEELLRPSIQRFKPVTTQDKFDHIEFVLSKCQRIVRSTFFTYSGEIGLDIEESLFISDFLRPIMAVANYGLGCSDFANYGVKHIKQILGPEGLWNLVNGKGGVCINWITTRPSPSDCSPFLNPDLKTPDIRWPRSPSAEVARVMSTPGFEDIDDQSRMDILSSQIVSALWTEGKPVKPPPTLHAELQLISYLEASNLEVLCGAIGMNQPPCWACHKYLRQLVVAPETENARQSPRLKYIMSQTTGRLRGPWLIPPGSDPIHSRAVLEALNKKVALVVEECCAYGL